MSKTLVINLTVEMVSAEGAFVHIWEEVPALFVNGEEVWRAPNGTYTRDGDPSYVESVIVDLFRKVLNK